MILGGLENTTSQRCTLHIQSTLDKFYYGLLHDLLSALRIGLKLLGITFFKNTCTFIYLIWSCTSSWQDLKRLKKYYRLEVQLAYLVSFAQFLLRFSSHFTFLHSKSILISWESLFSRKHVHLFIYFIWSCTSIWQGSDNTTGQRCSLFILSTLPNFCYAWLQAYFSELQISLKLLGIAFSKNTCTFIYLFIGLVPLTGRILIGSKNTTVVDFAQFLLWFAPHFGTPNQSYTP